MIEWTSQNAVLGMLIGTVFGNCFPFPKHWWKRCQTPVGVVIAVGVGYFFYQAS